jgi:hypothetical protein
VNPAASSKLPEGTRESRASSCKAKTMECVENLEITTQKNSPVYGDRHVKTDVPGTISAGIDRMSIEYIVNEYGEERIN